MKAGVQENQQPGVKIPKKGDEKKAQGHHRRRGQGLGLPHLIP
jgi:hypothetical protein